MAHCTVSRILALLFLGVSLLVSNNLTLAREKSDEEKKQEREKERQEKEDKRVKKEEKKHLKEAKEYATLMEFAEDYYEVEPDFREQVDRAYADLQQRHAMEAFRINTSRYEEIVAVDGNELSVRRSLYDNPRIQDYVNRVGQRLVPEDSTKVYAFKGTQSPVPYAYTLSTGTIYVSTGLLSLTDNEAQLAYVLSHELAHVYKDHWKKKVMSALAEDEYNKKKERRRAVWGSIIGAGIGAAVGGIAGRRPEDVAGGAMAGALAGMAIGLVTAKRLDVDWDYVQENEADDFALKNVLERNYDAQEVPKLYAILQQTAAFDERVGLGFIASGKRLKDRMEHTRKLLQTTFQTEFEKKMKAGQLVGTSPDYQLMMAELKRDNGILAFYFDMFNMARSNLRQAVNLRSDDARARFYYGKVLKLVARTDADKNLARQEFLQAIKLDEARRSIPEAELQRGLMLMDNPDSASQAEAAQALKNYILAFQESLVRDRKYTTSLPPNMEILYDYMRLLGETKWKAPFPEVFRVLAGDVVVAAGSQGVSNTAVAATPQAPVGTTLTPVKTAGQPQ